MSIMLITHDMAVIAALADAVIVMYMGEIVEQGSAVEILNEAAHPYTQALLRSLPVLGKGKQQDLVPIRGHTPGPFETIIGCQFAPRCDEVSTRCFQPPVDFAISATHTVRCWERGEAD
jgi:peptide/nickel transport system ATP-binding protein